ncbi:putative transcriptional regulator [Ochrobactrum sp. 19YEA23]|uniref:MucR family transcriptional regulator n=1 Tax=Ochrobactrum sp. 19YEA23 TaxID=3039854 RepID=UPI0024791B06|nr:putative transcriptional regulator [Ochrobactrum sp. 19YEA23]
MTDSTQANFPPTYKILKSIIPPIWRCIIENAAKEYINGNRILHVKLANNIITSYVNKNQMTSEELLNVITDVCQCIGGLSGGSSFSPKEAPATPSVDPKESIFEDYIICLEDGRRYKTLKRALMSRFGLTPDAYRRKWNLPSDYPMVAPASAKKMSALSRMEKDGAENA